MKAVDFMPGWLATIVSLDNRFRACLAIDEADIETASNIEEIGQLREAFFKVSNEDLPQNSQSCV